MSEDGVLALVSHAQEFDQIKATFLLPNNNHTCLSLMNKVVFYVALLLC